jgi:hypothetical protein
MNDILASAITTAIITPVGDRVRLAVRIFRFAVAVNLALTIYSLVSAFTGFGNRIAGQYLFNSQAVGRFLFSLIVFNGIWAVIWYGVKNLLLAKFVGMSRDDRRLVFSSRMSEPFDLQGLLARYPERRIRITDMIGRRGRFITLAMAIFYFLYVNISATHSENFASAFGPQTVFDAVLTNWLFIALYYVNGFLGAVFYGAQTRVMDGMLGRANCLLILTFWALFKFVLIPIGGQLQGLYAPEHFALLFAFIWGTYLVVDTLAEVGGSLYGTMKIKGARSRRREPQVDCRHRDRARRWHRVRCGARASQSPAWPVHRTRCHGGGDELAARALFTARHRRLHDGDGQCTRVLGVRPVGYELGRISSRRGHQ